MGSFMSFIGLVIAGAAIGVIGVLVASIYKSYGGKTMPSTNTTIEEKDQVTPVKILWLKSVCLNAAAIGVATAIIFDYQGHPFPVTASYVFLSCYGAIGLTSFLKLAPE